MKKFSRPVGLSILIVSIALSGCSKKESHVFTSLKDPATAAQLKQFVGEKRSQAYAGTNQTTPELDEFFAAAERGDWLTVSNHFRQVLNEARAGRLSGPSLATVLEVDGALEAFGQGDEKYSELFGNDIIQSIPPGSIYFGGTDPGRFVVTAMQKSQIAGDPFFTLTQNGLADTGYLDYLQAMYGSKINIPTKDEAGHCFEEYTADAQQRSQNHHLKPGEQITHDASGKPQPSGQVSIMEVNGLIAKVIFDKNPDREFYVEESYPLDWMYPYLEPHGLIMKISRQPPTVLSDDVIQADRDAWTKYTDGMIGNWLRDDTSVNKVAEFSETAFLNHKYGSYGADPRFIENADAQKWFSKLRSSIAGVYAWRAQHPDSTADKQRMSDAADFAFRQAVALCPYSPEAVYRYVAFLVDEKRTGDALVIAETAAKFKASGISQIPNLVNQLKRMQKSQ